MTSVSLEMLAWVGSISGAAGAIVLAPRKRYSGWGWVLFLLSNFFWIATAMGRSDLPQLFMQGVLTVTSLVGVWQYLIAPMRTKARLKRWTELSPSLATYLAIRTSQKRESLL